MPLRRQKSTFSVQPRQPKWLIILEAAGCVAVIGIVDYIVPWEFSLFVLYAAPILLTVWFTDRRVGIMVACACAAVWYWANIGDHPYSTRSGYFWATANRFAYFLFVAIGGGALRLQREQAQAQLEAMTRARELEQEIVQASEREQMRIGQDLHDGLCQSLAAIDCAAACLKADLAAKSLPEAKSAEEIQQMLQQTVVEARSLARGIFPVQMDAQGLSAALEELVENANRLYRLQVLSEIQGEVRVTNPEVGMHLYRIAQEALSNACRHSGADRIRVRLVARDGALHLSVEDNGRGLTPEIATGNGMGLRTIGYRAHLIGASFELAPNPGGGTVVHCSLPLTDA
ncbi:MAG TPA: sensor histidine kinase [Chthoniobacteraceae bacterium]|nr:sensor histidine kinase [Chthoniobacteraceae bacterium]